MLHTEWTAPLGLSAPLWGVLTFISYVVFVYLSKRVDNGQWDKGYWDKK